MVGAQPGNVGGALAHPTPRGTSREQSAPLGRVSSDSEEGARLEHQKGELNSLSSLS